MPETNDNNNSEGREPQGFVPATGSFVEAIRLRDELRKEIDEEIKINNDEIDNKEIELLKKELDIKKYCHSELSKAIRNYLLAFQKERKLHSRTDALTGKHSKTFIAAIVAYITSLFEFVWAFEDGFHIDHLKTFAPTVVSFGTILWATIEQYYEWLDVNNDFVEQRNIDTLTRFGEYQTNMNAFIRNGITQDTTINDVPETPTEVFVYARETHKEKMIAYALFAACIILIYIFLALIVYGFQQA